ncbi:hypothetical protein FA10DRAFT_289494 [Acaromyces ingoldii]|uniref:Uncharacterized protein n=1 Tax=Acaromyces ingoldii TaxID=215250 RepID=A0A316YBK2_9BASI|nr:hypothetical protein FA10DRAFT_289494 [Acaromyces ingoldii]PWN86917.1 hypothetical protein FA10DRAFT_289494 [Acaromyces ingoldii]
MLDHDTAWNFALSGTEEVFGHPIIGDWCREAPATRHEDRSDRGTSATPCLTTSPGSTGASTELSDLWMGSCRNLEEDVLNAAAVPLGCEEAASPSTAINGWFNTVGRMDQLPTEPVPAFAMDLEMQTGCTGVAVPSETGLASPPLGALADDTRTLFGSSFFSL